ncbi:MAG: T9SS type A sorting domain-containing protein [Ignavibacteria bacterium]|nr:T9SS type A sorting domain-containing protein [Ignavibacteria bacterium]
MKLVRMILYILIILSNHTIAQWKNISSIYGRAFTEYNGGVLVAASGGIYFIEKSGATWKSTCIGLIDKYTTSVAAFQNKIIAGTTEGVYVTNNLGQEWKTSNNGLPSSSSIRVLYVNDDKIYAGTQIAELFVSKNYGDNWECIRSSQQNEITRSIYASGSTILLGISGNFYGEYGSIYKSTNSGSSWGEFHEIFYKTDVYSIAQTSSTICLGTGAGLFVSNDNGLNWKRINKTTTNCVYAVGSNLIVSNKEISNDFGISWKKYDTGLPTSTGITAITVSDNFVYLSTDNGIYVIPSQEILTNIEDSDKALPSNYTLSQNYPNPFNPETAISFTIPVVDANFASTTNHVTLKIYDVLGREITTLVDEYKQPGNYKATFNVETRHGASLQSGVYFYQLRAGSFAETKKLCFIK